MTINEAIKAYRAEDKRTADIYETDKAFLFSVHAGTDTTLTIVYGKEGGKEYLSGLEGYLAIEGLEPITQVNEPGKDTVEE